MQPEFAITYHIHAEEWDRAAKVRFDPEAEPIFDCFYGDVEVLAAGQPVLGERAYTMSVADLACGLAQILRSELPSVGGDDTTTFRQSDDSLELLFERRGNLVRVSSNITGSESGDVVASWFFTGVRQFIQRFAGDVSSRIPNALEWKDLSGLREFV